MSFGISTAPAGAAWRARAGMAALVVIVIVTVSAAFGSPKVLAQPAPETLGRADPALIDEGRHLAELNCSSCHAVAWQGDSPNAMAPPFRLLSKNYPIDALDEAFAEGVFVGHSNMPQFQFTPDQVDALTAYLQSIQETPRRPAH